MNLKIRSSSTGYIMTEPRSKSEVLSETTKKHLIDVFVSLKYGRNNDIENKYTTKGTMVEEDSLTLYSRYKKMPFFKNKNLFENEFQKGTPDIVNGKTIIDIKSSWDIFTFHKTKMSLNKMYYWQLQSYMSLTGCDNAILAYCLVDTPDPIIETELRRLSYSIKDPDLLNAASEEIVKLSKYDDVPINEKVIEVNIKRDNEAIKLIGNKVLECRTWINENLLNNNQ